MKSGLNKGNMKTYNKISAIAAMAAISMVSLAACSDDNSASPLIDLSSSSDESALSSSSTPSVETESSSGGFVNLCEPLIEGAITRFWVKNEGDRLKDACSEPLTVIGDGVYAEDCNEENNGRVLSLWNGNPKYGYMTHYKCQKDSWVKGDISLTCDTAGVAVGDTCVKQYSINIFLAGMYPTGAVVSFVYQGDGIWTKVEMEDVPNIGEISSRQHRFVDPHGLSLGYSDWTCFINTEDGWDNIAFFTTVPNEITNVCEDYAIIYKACNVVRPALGDTCSFESDGKMHYYVSVKAKEGELNQWQESLSEN